eukprot:CAMPEP_0172160516 /NCGR_PEP_ID=MMETSP1050-20130122/5597_1 /TAXON_ID=233186 /ORGANISM="Cryptomonas curvata, Strain CCAP979/52" /LENGTH=431 /DNA_ID=CAMNT_0012830279 /DNA_START=105 /DNA_END=1400 /DNA_ORIENTATION=-
MKARQLNNLSKPDQGPQQQTIRTVTIPLEENLARESEPSFDLRARDSTDVATQTRELQTMAYMSVINSKLHNPEQTAKEAAHTAETDQEMLLRKKTTPGFIVDGNVVRNVFSGGPAERAGLRKGDVIQAINNLPTASDSSLLVKFLAAVPEGSTVFLTWLNKDEEVVRATVELVDSNRFRDVMQAYLKLLQLEDASAALVQSVDSVLRDEGSNALKSEVEMQDIVGKLGKSRTHVKDLTANLEGDVAAILSRQRAAEEELLLYKAKYEAYRQAHHNRHATNLEYVEEMQTLKELVQDRLGALGIDDMSLGNLEETRRENALLAELLAEVRETKATFRYKNKIIMEPREYEELLRRDHVPLLQVMDDQQRLLVKMQAENRGYQQAIDKVAELTETTLQQSAEIFRLNRLLQTYPNTNSIQGHSTLVGDWVPA